MYTSRVLLLTFLRKVLSMSTVQSQIFLGASWINVWSDVVAVIVQETHEKLGYLEKG